MDAAEKQIKKTHTITIVPRYAETDQGGVVHHSVYPVWFEMGRTELLRANGIVYKNLERRGIYFVIVRLDIKYRQPAKYYEKLCLKTECVRVTTVRIEHKYLLSRCEDEVLLSEASSVIACVDAAGGVRALPEETCFCGGSRKTVQP